jgi:amino acid permease
MLTALLAVALFMLGITSVIRKEKLKFAIMLGTIFIATFSIFILLRVPIVSVSW